MRGMFEQKVNEIQVRSKLEQTQKQNEQLRQSLMKDLSPEYSQHLYNLQSAQSRSHLGSVKSYRQRPTVYAMPVSGASIAPVPQSASSSSRSGLRATQATRVSIRTQPRPVVQPVAQEQFQDSSVTTPSASPWASPPVAPVALSPVAPAARPFSVNPPTANEVQRPQLSRCSAHAAVEEHGLRHQRKDSERSVSPSTNSSASMVGRAHLTACFMAETASSRQKKVVPQRSRSAGTRVLDRYNKEVDQKPVQRSSSASTPRSSGNVTPCGASPGAYRMPGRHLGLSSSGHWSTPLEVSLSVGDSSGQEQASMSSTPTAAGKSASASTLALSDKTSRSSLGSPPGEAQPRSSTPRTRSGNAGYLRAAGFNSFGRYSGKPAELKTERMTPQQASRAASSRPLATPPDRSKSLQLGWEAPDSSPVSIEVSPVDVQISPEPRSNDGADGSGGAWPSSCAPTVRPPVQALPVSQDLSTSGRAVPVAVRLDFDGSRAPTATVAPTPSSNVGGEEAVLEKESQEKPLATPERRAASDAEGWALQTVTAAPSISPISRAPGVCPPPPSPGAHAGETNAMPEELNLYAASSTAPDTQEEFFEVLSQAEEDTTQAEGDSGDQEALAFQAAQATPEAHTHAFLHCSPLSPIREVSELALTPNQARDGSPTSAPTDSPIFVTRELPPTEHLRPKPAYWDTSLDILSPEDCGKSALPPREQYLQLRSAFLADA